MWEKKVFVLCFGIKRILKEYRIYDLVFEIKIYNFNGINEMYIVNRVIFIFK